MVTKLTHNELKVRKRFLQDMDNVFKNPNQGMGSRIEQLAEELPNKPALYFQDLSWTWQTFNEESNRIANKFLKLGLNPSDTVAIMLENSPEYLFITSGINKIHGISAFININQKKQALTHAFNVAEPKWIIIDGDCLASFNEVVNNLPLKNDKIFVINNDSDISHDFIDLPNELKSVSKSNPITTLNSNIWQIAFYIFTSGTTGLPKAVKMDNFSFYRIALYLGIAFGHISQDDVIYIPTPLYHSVGMPGSWMSAVLLGATAALRKRFSSTEFWKDIQKYQATFIWYVGEIPRYLLNQPPSEYEKNHSLKKMVGLGLKKDIWEKFKNRFRIEHIYEYYGLTEGIAVFINADEVPGMVGRHITRPALILAKVNPETGEFYKTDKGFCIECQPGEIGMALMKIEKSTPFKGYKDKEKTQKKLMYDVLQKGDIYFNTGDMLQLHKEFWVSFADRFGDTFRWKSENVSTLEIEAIISSYPAIYMSAVYGVAIPNTEGKAGMATIKLNPSIKFDIEQFSKFIVEVLPKYSIPVFIRISDEIELTSSSYKVKKNNLKKEAYNIEIIKDPLFIWDLSTKMYKSLTKSNYQKIIDGKFDEIMSELTTQR
ncbi:MAG: AMP-binding protein [Promethearchaeota archaeon]